MQNSNWFTFMFTFTFIPVKGIIFYLSDLLTPLHYSINYKYNCNNKYKQITAFGICNLQ